MDPFKAPISCNCLRRVEPWWPAAVQRFMSIHSGKPIFCERNNLLKPSTTEAKY